MNDNGQEEEEEKKEERRRKKQQKSDTGSTFKFKRFRSVKGEGKREKSEEE